MARHAKPWWRATHNAYYATVRGVQYRLGTTKKQADNELKRLLKEEPHEVGDRTLFAVLLDDFLDFTKENRAYKTYRGHFDFCQSFLKKFPRIKTDELTPDHVTEWLRGQTTWNGTTKRLAINTLQRALNWAGKNKGLKTNVLSGMEKPEAHARSMVITEEEFKALLAEVKDRDFKELLIFSYDCGCRPQESKKLEARHFDLAKRRAVLPAAEAKGKKHPRAIYIPTSRALKIVKTRIKEFPERAIFRNRRGNPWTAAAVKCRFAQLEKKLGKRYHQTAFRRTWITRKLLAGVDSHVVASLSGHRSTAMIDRHYSAIAHDHAFMLAAAKKGT